MMYHYFIEIIPEQGPITKRFSGCIEVNGGIENYDDYNLVSKKLTSDDHVIEIMGKGDTAALVSLNKL